LVRVEYNNPQPQINGGVFSQLNGPLWKGSDMALLLAVKRSYRYFIPRSLLEPRKYVRQIYMPAVYYVVGITTGMYIYARPGEGPHITQISLIVMVALLILGRWAGVPLGGGFEPPIAG
jgi:hypothetical protein